MPLFCSNYQFPGNFIIHLRKRGVFLVGLFVEIMNLGMTLLSSFKNWLLSVSDNHQSLWGFTVIILAACAAEY